MNKKLNKNYFLDLPSGYELKLTMDATSKNLKIKGNIAATLLLKVTFIVTLLFKDLSNLMQILRSNSTKTMIVYFITFLLMFVYMVLHEIVHGIAYKFTTNEKLKFGIKLPVAYCGVPGIYCTKKTSLIALLTPFIVFDIVYITSLIIVKDIIIYIGIAFLLAVHVSGCCFDLYDSILLLFKFKKINVLMYDDGPVQKFYCKE